VRDSAYVLNFKLMLEIASIASKASTGRVDAVEAAARESTRLVSRERASGPRNARKRLEIDQETSHDLV